MGLGSSLPTLAIKMQVCFYANKMTLHELFYYVGVIANSWEKSFVNIQQKMATNSILTNIPSLN